MYIKQPHLLFVGQLFPCPLTLNIIEVKWKLTELTTRFEWGQLLLSVVLLCLRMHWIPRVLACRVYFILVRQEEGTICEERVKEQFFPLPLSPLYFSMFIRVTGACLLGYLGLMVGLSGFASHWCSLSKLAADSASSRISRHPTSTSQCSCW